MLPPLCISESLKIYTPSNFYSIACLEDWIAINQDFLIYLSLPNFLTSQTTRNSPISLGFFRVVYIFYLVPLALLRVQAINGQVAQEGDLTAVPAILELLEHQDGRIRLAAVEALGFLVTTAITLL